MPMFPDSRDPVVEAGISVIRFAGANSISVIATTADHRMLEKPGIIALGAIKTFKKPILPIAQLRDAVLAAIAQNLPDEILGQVECSSCSTHQAV